MTETTVTDQAVTGQYCDRCGEPASLADDGHAACRRMRQFEPPRYCPACRRRMIVQVFPDGWTARCSRHGRIGEEGSPDPHPPGTAGG